MKELSNELFCQMGDMADDGYFIYSTLEERFDYLNKSMASMLDVDLQLLIEKPNLLIGYVHPEDIDHAYSCYHECLEDMLPKKYELKLLLGTTEKYIRITIFSLIEMQNVFLCGTVEDITVAKHNKIHIEQINAHKNITLEVLSHDLKEPLGLMRLTASAMHEEINQSGNKNMVDSLLFIQEMCDRNMKLVRSIINREFLKSATIEIKRERTDLVWEMRDVIRFFRRSHLREVKEFRFSTSHEKIFMCLDSMKFLQVINNLLSNAIKFTPIGGVIELSLQELANSVIVCVADNGIGIPNEFKEDLFNRGARGLRPGLNGEESGGLGMSIIKTIIDLHGGLISFESEESKGTTFFIELPKQP